jgi:hypothetical protein
MFLSSSLWPLFWVLIGGGAAVAVLLSLAVAGFRRPQRDQQPLTRIAGAARYGDAAGRPSHAA